MKITKKRSLIRRMAVVAVLSEAIATPGLIGVTAATAGALPISNLASECRGANGGTWVVEYGGGGATARYVSGYACYYRDIDGNGYVDYYDRRGNYRNTS